MISTTGIGSMPAAQAIVQTGTAGYTRAGLRISGTFSGTVTFEGSSDGATWGTLTVTLFDGTTTVTTATSAGQWTVSCAGLAAVRMRMSTYSSGTADGAILVTG